MYKILIRPVLFLFDPEAVHHFSFRAIRFFSRLGLIGLFRKMFIVSDPKLEREVFGVKFKNPVGLAAGFDKDAKLYNEFSDFGFGFVEIGTVTPKPQPGNPKKRLFRLKDDKAIINRMGFNNPGMDAAARSFHKQDSSGSNSKRQRKHPRGVNIGKNKVTSNDEAIQDYIKCFRSLQSYADYVTVNISSPNTPGLRDLQSTSFLSELLGEMDSVRTGLNSTVPIFVKLAPDIDDRDLPGLIETACEGNATGLILTNTTISRDIAGASDEMRNTQGGLSGAPLFDRSTDLLRKARDIGGKKLALIGVGGIDSPEKALAKILAGADLIQIYTGYIFQGPTLPAKIARFLDRVCKKEGCTISDLRGQEAAFSHWLQGHQ